ncbi:MFS transporter [Mycoplasmatota bacterium WC44]
MFKYKLPKVIYFICIGKIFMELGNYLWPLFTLLGVNYFGFTETKTANYLILFTVLAFCGTIIGGKLTDSFGRKRTFTTFMFVSALCCILATYATGQAVIWLLTINALVISIGGSSTTAMITDLSSSDQERKDAFALYYIAMNFGFAFGLLLGGYLYDLDLLKWLFMGDGLTTGLFALVVLFFVPETLPKQEDFVKVENTKEAAKEGNVLKMLSTNKPLLIFLFINLTLFIVFRQFTFAVPLYSDHLFGNPGTIFGIIMSVNAGMVVIFTTPILKLTEKYSIETKIIVGGLCYLIGFGMLAFINNISLFILSSIIWTIGEIFISPNSKLYIASHSPITHRGRFSSIFMLTNKVASILGFIIAGYLIENYSFGLMWISMGIISLVGVMLMYMSKVRKEEVVC